MKPSNPNANAANSTVARSTLKPGSLPTPSGAEQRASRFHHEHGEHDEDPARGGQPVPAVVLALAAPATTGDRARRPAGRPAPARRQPARGRRSCRRPGRGLRTPRTAASASSDGANATSSRTQTATNTTSMMPGTVMPESLPAKPSTASTTNPMQAARHSGMRVNTAMSQSRRHTQRPTNSSAASSKTRPRMPVPSDARLASSLRWITDQPSPMPVVLDAGAGTDPDGSGPRGGRERSTADAIAPTTAMPATMSTTVRTRILRPASSTSVTAYAGTIERMPPTSDPHIGATSITSATARAARPQPGSRDARRGGARADAPRATRPRCTRRRPGCRTRRTGRRPSASTRAPS